MTVLIFATNNLNKLKEVKDIISDKFTLKTLADIGFSGEIPETSPTIEGNALQKAEYIYNLYKTNVFADDTGLEVEALNGAPGVYSARYAGVKCSYMDNVVKLLSVLKGVENRKARFKTVIALYFNNEVFYFEGIINGEITTEIRGNKGFGYDPVFVPEGFKQTFAEMHADLKNEISHRAIAVNNLANFFNKN